MIPMKLQSEYLQKRRTSKIARNYYANKNDIIRNEKIYTKRPDNPLRNADNRISHNWHQLLVDQKTSYVLGKPPVFDTGQEELDELIKETLGVHFTKQAKDLCINASNDGISWIHIWIESGKFHYAVIDDSQIIAEYGPYVDDPVEVVWRVYSEKDYVVYEKWDKYKVVRYKDKNLFNFEGLELLNFPTIGGSTFHHGWGKVPFIPFRNNSIEQSDLDKNKDQIDVYDKVFSGFVDDLDDIQEIIFVLTNYSGTDKQDFLDDLNKFKMVKLEQDDETEGNIDTLAIEIPTEARNSVLQTTQQNIFVSGQGVDPLAHIGNNNSGSALKYMYSLLELKASMLITEFTIGFDLLMQFIFKHHGKEYVDVAQIWERTSISNDVERAEILNKVQNVTSIETIAKNNPLVTNAKREVELIEKEIEEYGKLNRDIRATGQDNRETIEGKDGSSQKVQ